MVMVDQRIRALVETVRDHANDRGSDNDALTSNARRLFPLMSHPELVELVVAARAERSGLGPLEPLLADPEVTEVLVNGTGEVWIEAAGVLRCTDLRLEPTTVERFIERVIAPLGQRIDRLHPFVDARLADGSRVHAVIAPVSVDGPCLTIRRFAARTIALDRFCNDEQHHAMREIVTARRSVLVCGGTGSGKTTLLNTLASLIGDDERVVTIEDTAELRLPNRHVVRLEGRRATVEGLGEVTLRDLVRTSLRMRPDRIIVGEVRGGEALDMIQAMSTGHRGSMSTIHADNALNALYRLELLVMLATTGLDLLAVRRQIALALDVVVSVQRRPNGERRIDELVEVRLDGDRWVVASLGPNQNPESAT